MSIEPDKPPRIAEAHLSILPSDQSVGSEGQGEAATGRTEAQLRARIEQLETALAEISRCLEDAERRAADQLATRAHLQALDQKLQAIVGSKSWRLTTPLRQSMERARRSLGR